MHKDVDGLITGPLSSGFKRRDDQPLMLDPEVSQAVMDDGLLRMYISEILYVRNGTNGISVISSGDPQRRRS